MADSPTRVPWRMLAVIAIVAALLPALPEQAGAQQVLPCDQGSGGNYARVSRPATYDFLPQQVITIPSALDGVDIQIGIVRPDVPAGQRVPVIVEASVYYHPMQEMDLRRCKARLTENFVPQGYAVALVAVRGSADSGGCMNLMGPKERADLDHAITWLGQRPWSNGAVGMTGLSYNGSTPWMVAAYGNPYLKTIVPGSGVPDLFDLLFGGGVPDWRGPSTVINNLYYAESVVFYAPGRSLHNTREVVACPEYADGNAAALYSGATGELDPIGYWAPRRYRDQVEENYRGSILLVQGLQDWNVNPGQQFPWVPELVERSRQDPGTPPPPVGPPGTPPGTPPGPPSEEPGITVKYMLGQWGHSMPDGQRSDWGDVLLDWFDYWLKGDRTVDLGAGAEVRDSSGRWRRADTWPQPGTETTWSLTADGRLTSATDTPGGTKRVTVDPAHLQGGAQTISLPEDVRSRCEDVTCAVFRTEAFDEPFHLAGLPNVRLSVTPTGPGGQLSVYLFADRDGQTPQRRGWGQVDLRFPNGVPRGTPQAQPVAPGEEMEVDFTLQPLDVVIPAGSRLMMVVSGGSAYNRLPTVPNYPVDIAVGGDASTLTVTRVHPDPDDFFTPGQSEAAPGGGGLLWSR